MLTSRRPDTGLADFCRRHGLVLARISTSKTPAPRQPGADPGAGWIDVRLTGDGRPGCLRALTVLGSNPALTVIVRPDCVIAAVEPRYQRPRLAWYTPASAVRGHPATARPPVHHDPAGPLPAAR